jgi:hypothetical protein
LGKITAKFDNGIERNSALCPAKRFAAVYAVYDFFIAAHIFYLGINPLLSLYILAMR